MKQILLILCITLITMNYSAALACNSPHQLCRGDRVIYGNSVRSVEAVDNTGRVVLSEDYSHSRTFTTASYVAKIIPCYRSYCSGDQVFYGNAIRKIEFTSIQGNIVLAEDYSHSRTFVYASSISKINGDCRNSSRLCKGDLVLYGNAVRKVEFLDNTGRVVLEEDSYHSRYFTTVSNVTKVVRCSRSHCTNDIVFYGDSTRKIAFLDNTGRVVLEEDHYHSRTFTYAENISKTTDCFGDYCRGDTVLYGNSIRIIELLDNTGRVLLAENNSHSATYTTNSSISMVQKCFRHNNRYKNRRY